MTGEQTALQVLKMGYYSLFIHPILCAILNQNIK